MNFTHRFVTDITEMRKNKYNVSADRDSNISNKCINFNEIYFQMLG